jgi:hypothetical protein
MRDPNVSSRRTADATRWLLLITEVPSKPDYLRVKLRRRIQRLGAIGLKGAVYVLPGGTETEASFQLLRQEISADGGDATLCVAKLVDGLTDEALILLFNRERDAEYANFVSACSDLERRWKASNASAGHGDRLAMIAERARYMARLAEILARDHFGAPRREDAMQAIERLAVLDVARSSANLATSAPH